MKENKIIILIELAFDFVRSLFESLGVLAKHLFTKRKDSILKENRFLDAMNFICQIWPRSYWKKPTGIALGRSVSTFLHYIFEKGTAFREGKKFDK